MSGGGGPVPASRRFAAWWVLLAAFVGIAAAVLLVLLIAVGGAGVAGDDSVSRSDDPIATDTPAPTPVPVVQIVIPAISLDAPVVPKAVDADGQMPSPDDPEQVVWYDFSALPGLGGSPGFGGNTVLAGHVDYHGYGAAIFSGLRDLKEGDEITVRLRDGREYKYAAQSNRVVDPSSTRFNEIVASTPEESLTMITCAGDFNPDTREYNERRVVWAVRIG
jgi:LPXTG-site transpeptidase (sortase) family protein